MEMRSAVYLDDEVDEVPLPEDELDLLDSDDDVPDELEALPLDEPALEEPLPLDFADEPLSEVPLSEEVPFRA